MTRVEGSGKILLQHLAPSDHYIFTYLFDCCLSSPTRISLHEGLDFDYYCIRRARSVTRIWQVFIKYLSRLFLNGCLVAILHQIHRGRGCCSQGYDVHEP